jgi:hypothetical protein
MMRTGECLAPGRCPGNLTTMGSLTRGLSDGREAKATEIQARYGLGWNGATWQRIKRDYYESERI